MRLEYRQLGGSGLNVPVLSLGTGTFGGGTELFKAWGETDVGPPVPLKHVHNIVDAIDEVAHETGKSVPQIALNWLLQRPSISTIIIGARNEEQLRQNIAAVGWNLTSEQITRLDAASEVTPAYPYWHQRGFAERNPPPV